MADNKGNDATERFNKPDESDDPTARRMLDARRQEVIDQWQKSLGVSLLGLGTGMTYRAPINGKSAVPVEKPDQAFGQSGSAADESLSPSLDSSVDPDDAATNISATARNIAPIPDPFVSAGGATFEIIEALGKGGMGVVHRAVQPGLERQVALKRMLHPEGPGRDLFLAEAHVTSRLEHPNIVPVYELVSAASGEAALAMKLVRGTSWRDRLKARKGDVNLDLDFHLSVLQSVAQAVGFAHSRRISHNDLKPENVMLGEFGEVLVMDWGLAHDFGDKALPGPVRHRSLITTPCGTPNYFPPELARGHGHKLGPWTDTYLLGSILYEIVSGAPPHKRPTFPETIAAAASGEVRPLPATVPEGLRHLCERAMQAEPSMRYQKASDVHAAIQLFLKSRESLLITDQAQAQLEKALPKKGATDDDLPRDRVYLALAEAGAGFRQALLLWPENERAQKGSQEASVVLAEVALVHGDLGLAGSEVERLAGTPHQARLAAAVEAARRSRVLTARQSAWLRQAVVGLLAAIIAVLAIGLWAVRSQEKRAEEAALDAQTQAKLADRRLEDVRRLADVKKLEEQQALEGTLWPATPEMAPQLEGWLSQARRLVAALDAHKASLAALEASGQGLADGGFSFAADHDRWQHDMLAELIGHLQGFAARDIPAIEARLAFAQSVQKDTVASRQIEWDQTIATIADVKQCPMYQGFRLTPQVGLVPLGRDPSSGLFEFAHLESGTLPSRGPDGKLRIDEGSAVVLVLVPGGTLRMGDAPADKAHAKGPNLDPDARAAEGPVHDVALDPFFLSKFEMTQGQWLRATGTNPSAYKAGQVVGEKTLSKLNPVEQIGWDEAALTLTHWGLSLPTEAQWEYAARGGTSTVYWEGGKVEDLQGAANLADRYCKEHGGPASWVYEPKLDDGWVTHAPVGSFRANPFGLHDMQGNVWEWCQDRYGPYTLPVAPKTGERLVPGEAPRVFRGGGFRSSAVHARSADRYSLYYAGSKAFDVGVRPAKAVQP